MGKNGFHFPLMYNVLKTANKRYPVYTDYKQQRVTTIIRRISGNINALQEDLQAHFKSRGKQVQMSIKATSQQIELKGKHGQEVISFLSSVKDS